ncbi:MAG: hypothetical protein NZ959_07745 [Armatimonadetes bacterium]|nr:hypothetical protein [Armatimonadota bacterium]MDW8121677.1 hypothetical protein [Armatimonadota bacterium]
MKLSRALCGFIAGGGVFLLFETVIGHQGILSQHPVAGLSVVASLLCIIAAFNAFLQPRPMGWTLLQVVSVIVILIGVAGIYFHNASRLGLGPRQEVRAVEGDNEERGKGVPPLAPLSLSGMGILGLMATHPRWREE